MIVVDSNVIAYLYLQGEHTAAAERLLLHEPDWAAPALWRSEFRNILADSACSAYDCEFVALASLLGTKLVTMDKK